MIIKQPHLPQKKSAAPQVAPLRYYHPCSLHHAVRPLRKDFLVSFTLPSYTPPDFEALGLSAAPNVRTAPAPADGVAPLEYHSTSMFPEYFKIDGRWQLAPESRMDASVVLRKNGSLDVVENRNLSAGDVVILGRSEDGSEGIYVHPHGFEDPSSAAAEKFAFRAGRSRETAFARDYDTLYELLRHEREHGKVVWVMGPAFSFDHDARRAMQRIIEAGYVGAVLAGNALATHDLEGARFHTALGQDIYTQKNIAGGHYHHLDVINEVRAAGSIARFIEEHEISDGIMYALETCHVPYVLAGSIRDDGPLPEVVGDAYAAQTAMREQLRDATCVICLATMLHTIAAGNITPSFRVLADGTVRPVYFYAVDADEFVVNKLLDRGSLAATTIVTNVQDFITLVASGLGVWDRG